MKRIKVLKDALSLIKSRSLIATTGSVFSGLALYDVKGQLKGYLSKHLSSGKKCTVCQRGALLCSLVLNDNSFKTVDLLDQGPFSSQAGKWNSKIDKRLSKIFSDEQIAMMETAFEVGLNRAFLGEEKYLKAKSFATYGIAEERAIAILENAIANRGIFKP
jgi:hypothetical protein